MNANATKIEKLARLNELRVAAGKPELKAWKESNAKLDAAIAKLEPIVASNAAAAADPANADLVDRGFTDAELGDLERAVDGPTLPTVEPTAPVVELSDADFPETLRACLLIYDIPSASDYRNPSRRLRRIGFRENKSCWVIPEGSIPHKLIHEMKTEGNASVELIRFDAGEGPRLCRMAIERIKRELTEKLARAESGIAKADKKYLKKTDDDADLADNVSAREDVLKRYERRASRIIAGIEKLCKDVESAIKNFGVRPELLGLADTRNAMDALQKGYEARSGAYVAATEALRKIGTADADALANAADADAVPAAIMADMLRDNGNNAAADALTAAFSDAPANTDGTFSLTDETK